MSACRSCRASILWVGTENGKAMPLDAEPYQGDSPTGRFVIRVVDRDEGGQKVVAVAVPTGERPDEPVYRSHFSTCPQAGGWRKPT